MLQPHEVDIIELLLIRSTYLLVVFIHHIIVYLYILDFSTKRRVLCIWHTQLRHDYHIIFHAFTSTLLYTKRNARTEANEVTPLPF